MSFWESREKAKRGGVSGLMLSRKKEKKEGDPAYVKAIRERSAIEKEKLEFNKEKEQRIASKRSSSSNEKDFKGKDGRFTRRISIRG